LSNITVITLLEQIKTIHEVERHNEIGMIIPNQYDQFIKDPQLLENSLSNLNLKS